MYVGIDIGTQSLKVVVADDQIRMRGVGAVGYAVSYPRPGWAEQDPGDWERALAPAIAAALTDARTDAGAIRAIGVSGQLDGCVPVSADGRAQGPCLIWMDRRATECIPALPADFRHRTGLVADAGHMAAKIAWLKQRSLGTRFHQPVSYLVEALTGEFVFDPALASTTMLFDLSKGVFDAELCGAFAIDVHELPRVAAASSAAGVLGARGAALTGLLPGTPVAVGTGDDFATPLGAGVTQPGVMVCVIGTAEVVGAVSARPIIDERGLLETHGYLGERYFVENPGWLSGGAVAWARSLLGFDSDTELDAAAATVAPGAEGLTFLPALTGSMAPEWHAGARGCFYGLTPSHQRSHLARAVLEGCAFAMHDVQLRLGELGESCGRIAVLGGGAHSDVWLQMRSDLAGVAVDGATTVDSCALGAAALAVVACGDDDDVDRVARRSEQPTRHFEPNGATRDAYAEGYERYRELFAALTPMFADD